MQLRLDRGRAENLSLDKEILSEIAYFGKGRGNVSPSVQAQLKKGNIQVVFVI